MTLEEAEEALQRVLDYYDWYTDNKDNPKRKVYTAVEAYEKCIRRWPDAIFDGYSYPKVRPYKLINRPVTVLILVFLLVRREVRPPQGPRRQQEPESPLRHLCSFRGGWAQRQ